MRLVHAVFALCPLVLLACGSDDPKNGNDNGDSSVDTDVDAPADNDLPLDTTPPVITGTFPPTYVGIEGPTTTVTVLAEDEESDVTGVTVGTIAAVKDARGVWLARGVPMGSHLLTVTNSAGLATTKTMTFAATQPFIRGTRFMTSSGDGRVYAYDATRATVLIFDPDNSPRNVVVSGPGRGSGASLDADALDERNPIGMTFVDGTVLFAVADGANDTMDVIAIDSDTGNRTLLQTCTAVPIASAFVAATGTLFYVAIYQDTSNKVVSCSTTEAAAALVDTVPFATPGSVSAMAFDGTNQRLIVPDGTFGEVYAISTAGGAAAQLQLGTESTNDGVRAVTILNNEIYFGMYDGGLRHPTGDLQGEILLSYATDNYVSAMAPCGTTASDLCMRGLATFRVVNDEDTWTATRIEVDNHVGSGTDTSYPAWLKFPDDDAFGSVVFQANGSELRRISIASGSETVLVASMPSGGGPLEVLPSGTALLPDASRPHVANLFASPITFTELPGGDLYLNSGFTLVPANTRLVEEAVIYPGTTNDTGFTQLRMRGLTSGDDTLIVDIDTNYPPTVVANDGTIFVITSTEVARIAVGSSTLEHVGERYLTNTLIYDDHSASMISVNYYVSIFDSTTGVLTNIDRATLNPPLSPLLTAPGPYAHAAFGFSFLLDRGLTFVDIDERSVYVILN